MRPFTLTLLALAALPAQAVSPVDFGRRELLAASEARGLRPDRFRIVTEHSMVLPADGFSIQGYLIRGGNLRGIMFGLLEAAAQVRKLGGLRPAKAAPAIHVRGVRWTAPLPDDPAPLFATLARARFNRFVAAHSAESTGTLRKAAEAAAAHGLDFGAVALPGSSPRALVSAIPLLKTIESAATQSNLAEVAAAGRLVTLDLDGPSLSGEAFESALASRIPLCVIVQPGDYGAFLRKPVGSARTRPWQVVWRIQPSPAASPASVRAILPSLTIGQSQGFELELDRTPPPPFLEIWGRLAYNPAEPDSLFFSKPSPDLLAALDAAATLPPLRQAAAGTANHPWHASPAEAARLRFAEESSAQTRPYERASALEEAARVVEKAAALLPDSKQLAAHARESARRLAEADDLAWSRALSQRSAPGDPPNRHPGVVTRPAFDHAPPRQALAGQPLLLTLRLSSASNLKSLRLHWRPLNSDLPWRVLDAPPSRPAFTIPASGIVPFFDLEYYFEILHTLGSGWFLPEIANGAPFRRFIVPVAAPVEPPGGP